MASILVPIMAYYPEQNLDYSLVGAKFTLVETYLEEGNPAAESILVAAKQQLQAIFPTGTTSYDATTGKVSLSVDNVYRVKAEAFLDALRGDIKFAQLPK